MPEVKYPDITVNLVGQDGNVFNLMGICTKAMRKGGVSQEEIKQFREECMEGDYDHALRVMMSWVNVE